ncbi:YdeI/OmpD-associated family protein [Clostridium oceanicum]|uniref:Antitermination protein NusB n=1 Tax=Clostridium oceanicum TaxID=1543 RepID=A0ABN1JFG4_9CLOT
MEQFIGEIKKMEGKDASYVEIPFDVEKIYGSKRPKVKATFDGYKYRGSIVRMGGKCYMIGITKKIRNDIGKTFGDSITVTIEKDEEERRVQVPDELQKIIIKDDDIKNFWESLSFSMKKKYVTWINSAKKEETRFKRLNITIEKLKNKEKL